MRFNVACGFNNVLEFHRNDLVLFFVLHVVHLNALISTSTDEYS